MLSASTCKLTRLSEKADEYTDLIMEELDPERLGYIELWQLESLLLQPDTCLDYQEDTSGALSRNLQSYRLRPPKYKISMPKMRTNNTSYILQNSWKKALRLFRNGLYSVRLFKVAQYPGNVLMLQMSKPPQFRYKSGQYINVQCTAISSFEWHPFSLTSAPGDDYLRIHIEKLGDWTQELHRVFTEETSSFPELLINGPYDAPAQDYCKYDVVLLVGQDIGVTPFISILKDLMNNIIKKDDEEKAADELYPVPDLNMDSPKQKKPLQTTNAYFYWLTKEEGSFDWFRDVMNEVAELNQRGIIEMHNHLTSVYEEGDARSAFITMVSALNRAKYGVDIVSGTRVRTHFAKPNWKKVLANICSKHVNARIGVFCSNEPVLAKELEVLCNKYNERGATKFEFHKEPF